MSGQQYERPPGPLTDLSPSRVRSVQTCSLAFRYEYVDRIPALTESASALFGNVVHDGVQVWYGEPDSGDHQRLDLANIFHGLWAEYLPAGIWPALERCLEADRALEALAQAILISRPELKAPRQTKDFLSSAEFKQFEDHRENLIQKCDDLEEMRWPKDESPFQAYRKSMVVAASLTQLWKQKPRPLFVEEPFLLTFEGYTIKGRIDQIRCDPNEQGEPGPLELWDIKTGRQLMSQMEAFIQAFLYDEACFESEKLPSPELVTFWMARHDKPQRGKIDRERHRKLALRVLNNVARTIITGAWEPSYGHWCKRCDFAELCEEEINLWPAGSEGLVLEAA